jgi:hypothetical protein
MPTNGSSVVADTRLPEGDISTWDEDNLDEAPTRVGPMDELGVTGLKRVSGYVDEEFLPALRGRKAVRIYREMSCNDSMVGALLFTVDKLLREVEWKVLPADQTPENVLAQEFLESCMEDMSHSWDDFIGEVLSMLPYGWSWHEIVYKRRMGPWQKDAKKRSKHEDGLIGWRKMPIRAQETLLRWGFDQTGGIKQMVQMAPPRYQTTVIPIQKSLLFRTSIAKGNPEGVSLLRTSYRSWYFKKRLEEFEAIGVERDLAGMPVGRVPADYLTAQKGTPQAKTVDAFRKMVRGVRRDENEGLVLPTQYDPDTKQPMFDFELMTSGGTRQFDTNAIINRYEQRILMSMLADFILVGHESTGSYSLHTDKTGIFRAALNAITKAIADTLNRHAVPRLFEMNGWKLDELPRFEPTNVDPPDLTQLSQFISSTAGAGMQWFPDPELEKYIREIARLPEMTDEDIDYKRQMLDQQQTMEYAGGQMELLGMKQKAEMTAQGLSPEQAQMASETPTPEMSMDQGASEQDAEMARRMHPVGQEDEAKEQEMMAQQQELEQAKIQPQEDSPANQANFEREQAKTDMAEQSAQSQHGRETEKMTLQEQIAERQHQREIETLKAKAQADEQKAKQAKAGIGRPAKAAGQRKPPPKRGK